MPAFRAALAAFLALAFLAGYGTRYAISHGMAVACVAADDPRYCVTPHIQQYYDALRVSNPPPLRYQRGAAGTNYCLNMAQWFIAVQGFVSHGMAREVLRKEITPHLDYEVDHSWLLPDDRQRILKYIDVVSTAEEDLAALAELVFRLCTQLRGEVEA